MEKLNLGFIGCGAIATMKHFPALLKQKHRSRMMAFCDLALDKATNAAEKFGEPGAKAYTDYQELLADRSIDAVYVLTPNVSHAEISVAALDAGKHVMCEKPIAISSAEARTMLDAAARNGKKLTVAYQNRFRADSQMLYKACRAGDLGDIYMGKAHAVRRRGVPTWGVFPDKSKQGGGPLIDIGTHALDLTLWMMDNYKPKLVMGSVFEKMRDNFEGNWFGPWDPKTFEVEDSAFGLIKMENGATIYLEAAWAINFLRPKEGQVTLAGTKAGAEMFGEGAAAPNSPVHTGHANFNYMKYDEQMESHPGVASAMAAAHLDDTVVRVGDPEQETWLDAIINGGDPVVKPEQAFVVTMILEAIYKSAATGKAVEF